MPDELRKKTGAFFTPRELADRMTEVAGDPRTAVDLSCGDGALLSSISRRNPDCQLVGVELDLDLAAATAIRSVVEGFDVSVICGDGLAERGGRFELVILNPPYLGEKGNRETFRRLKKDHPHLSEAFVPRQDLSNLFLMRGLQLLEPGGKMVALTSEYWLQSDSAQPLRRAIRSAFGAERFIRFGAGQFRDAPGHHSLITVVAAAKEFVAEDDGSTRVGDVSELEAGRWNPFEPPASREGEPLGTIVRTSQGFVSGADRLTRRHLREFPNLGEVGAPIFMFDREPPAELRDRAEPVLRGSQIEAGQVIQSFEPQCWVIWVDAELPATDPVVKHLEKFRPILERRREARTGAMPWYRLHWPRSRAEMARPKLVTPRRTPNLCFALDCSGAPVSSDCTFIVAPEGVLDEVGFLRRLMAQLHEPSTEAWLRRNGKVKGDLMEMYAGPLEELPIDRDRLFSTA